MLELGYVTTGISTSSSLALRLAVEMSCSNFELKKHGIIQTKSLHVLRNIYDSIVDFEFLCHVKISKSGGAGGWITKMNDFVSRSQTHLQHFKRTSRRITFLTLNNFELPQIQTRPQIQTNF